MIALQEYQARYSKTGMSLTVSVVSAIFFGIATLLGIVWGYSVTLWGASLILFGISLGWLPVFQTSLVKGNFKKYPPVEHTVVLSEDKVTVRNVNQTSDSSWAEVKEVWKTKRGYVFFNRYDTTWFFLPQRLFSDVETELKMTALLEGAHVAVKIKP